MKFPTMSKIPKLKHSNVEIVKIENFNIEMLKMETSSSKTLKFEIIKFSFETFVGISTIETFNN